MSNNELILAILGGIGVLIGNIIVALKSHMASQQATRAVDANTAMTGSQAKLTTDLATKAEANYAMLRELMAEFRRQASSDRDASLTRAVENIWQTRERVLLARHNETMEFLHYILAHIKGAPPAPLTVPGPEAHGITNLPPLTDPPQPSPPTKAG